MAKKKNHLHASNSVLAVGLVFVMLLALVMGLSQVKQSQTSDSRADEPDGLVAQEMPQSAGGTYSGVCNIYAVAPKIAGNNIVGESLAFFCNSKVVKTYHKTWIQAVGESNFVSGNAICTCTWRDGKISSCTGTGTGAKCLMENQSDAVRSHQLLDHTAQYCSWGRVAWKVKNSDKWVWSSPVKKCTSNPV